MSGSGLDVSVVFLRFTTRADAQRRFLDNISISVRSYDSELCWHADDNLFVRLNAGRSCQLSVVICRAKSLSLSPPSEENYVKRRDGDAFDDEVAWI
jgi:hypothetical protein